MVLSYLLRALYICVLIWMIVVHIAVGVNLAVGVKFKEIFIISLLNVLSIGIIYYTLYIPTM